ncbi:MAG: hypothetical protein D6748_16225 [Calditrichaeota bacterium]|nr:MAG: hypothetical protein D6748_16225 [Calditrichota bacterium]
MIYWAYSNFKNFVAKTFFVFFDNIKVGSENSKLFINILLVLFINIAIANIYAQSVGNRVVKYSLNNLIFSADLPDFIYSYNDTVNIQYSVINHSKMTVYIFDPTQYYSPATVEPGYDSTYCLYKYKLGGSWFYNLGYINELKLTKIEPDSKYEYTFRLILQRKSQKQRCLYGLAPSREPEGLISRQVTFDIGFIPTSDSLRLKSLNKGYVDFESVKDVIYFEGHLRRFFLGPLWFRIKDQ